MSFDSGEAATTRARAGGRLRRSGRALTMLWMVFLLGGCGTSRGGPDASEPTPTHPATPSLSAARQTSSTPDATPATGAANALGLPSKMRKRSLPTAAVFVRARFLVSPGQVGPVRAGASGEELQAQGLARLNRECDPVWNLTVPDLSGSFLINFDHDPYGRDLDRVDIASRRYKTAAGIGIGSTFKDLLDAYGSRLYSPPDENATLMGVYPTAVVTTNRGSITFGFSVGPRYGPARKVPITQIGVVPPVKDVPIRFMTSPDFNDPC